MKWEPNNVQPEHNDNHNRSSLQPPTRGVSPQQAAVARMTRDQISAIYQQQATADSPDTPVTTPVQPSPEPTPTVVATEPHHATYNKQHTAPSLDSSQSAHLKQYHTAWQEYYQKYYERYYTGQVHQAHQAMQQHIASIKKDSPAPPADQTMSEGEAIDDLRQKLLTKVQASAQKARKSRHFVPVASALAVMLIFAFLQYNSILVAYAKAYVVPGSIDPQNIIVDPSLSLSVPPEPRLVIPKINVDTAVDYNAKTDHGSQMKAMKDGVAFFGVPGANSRPGQLGNVPIAGHSSNDFTETGSGKFIFARLEQLKKGDTFYLNYKGKRYTYTVRDIMVVKPSEVSKLNVGTKRAMATLITCTPLGTAEKRLLVFGEQISPSVSEATKAPAKTDSSQDTPEMAGKAPTLIERLFGAR